MNAPALKFPREPSMGSLDHELLIHGVEVLVTFNLEGHHYAATETDPEEFPTVEVVSVSIGGGPHLFGADCLYWDEQLALTEKVQAAQS